MHMQGTSRSIIQLASEYGASSPVNKRLTGPYIGSSAHDEGLRLICSFFPNNDENRLNGNQSGELAALQGEGKWAIFNKACLRLTSYCRPPG